MSGIELCGADTLVREPVKAKINPMKVSAVRSEITWPFAAFMAVLREIFEESAYERFLDRRSLTSSPAAYGDFLRETEAANARRPRCC